MGDTTFFSIGTESLIEKKSTALCIQSITVVR